MVIDANTICNIENLKLIEEDGEYFLDISILIDSRFETGRYKAMAKLPIVPSKFSVSEDRYNGKMIDLGFGYLPCVCGMTYETIKQKEQIMTLDEIEKKLGYKIKLVSEK
jgi:hypothetical protein